MHMAVRKHFLQSTMKTIASLVITALAISTATTQAHDCNRSFPVSHCAPVYTPIYCAPRLVCTKELCRHTECCWAYDSCGHAYSFEKVVITYENYYRDGSVRQYTRSYRV